MYLVNLIRVQPTAGVRPGDVRYVIAQTALWAALTEAGMMAQGPMVMMLVVTNAIMVEPGLGAAYAANLVGR